MISIHPALFLHTSFWLIYYYTHIIFIICLSLQWRSMETMVLFCPPLCCCLATSYLFLVSKVFPPENLWLLSSRLVFLFLAFFFALWLTQKWNPSHFFLWLVFYLSVTCIKFVHALMTQTLICMYMFMYVFIPKHVSVYHIVGVQ